MEERPQVPTLSSGLKLPDWFLRRCTLLQSAHLFRDSGALGACLSAAEEQIYRTYSEFTAQARAVFLFAFGTIAISASLVGLAANQPPEIKRLLLVGAGISLLSFPLLGRLALNNMRGRYRTYVASVLQSAYFHYAAGIPTHPWFEWLEEYLARDDVHDARSLIEVWIDTPPNAYLPYRNSAIVFSIILAIVGALLLWAAWR